MKRVLAFTCVLSLTLLLTLTACNKQQSQQPDTSQQEPEPTINQVEPEPEQPTVTQLSQSGQEQPQEEIIQGDELIAVFQHIYDACKDSYVDEDEQLRYEIAELDFYVYTESQSGKTFPDDYCLQYIDWRPVEENTATPAPSEGTSSNQTATPTEAVQSPSDSGSPEQGTQLQGGETPASGENPSGEVDLFTQHIVQDPSTFEGGAEVKPDQVNSYNPDTGWGSAGHFGIGVHVG